MISLRCTCHAARRRPARRAGGADPRRRARAPRGPALVARRCWSRWRRCSSRRASAAPARRGRLPSRAVTCCPGLLGAPAAASASGRARSASAPAFSGRFPWTAARHALAKVLRRVGVADGGGRALRALVARARRCSRAGTSWRGDAVACLPRSPRRLARSTPARCSTSGGRRSRCSGSCRSPRRPAPTCSPARSRWACATRCAGSSAPCSASSCSSAIARGGERGSAGRPAPTRAGRTRSSTGRYGLDALLTARTESLRSPRPSPPGRRSWSGARCRTSGDWVTRHAALDRRRPARPLGRGLATPRAPARA